LKLCKVTEKYEKKKGLEDIKKKEIYKEKKYEE
jgi:hypothetical protein